LVTPSPRHWIFNISSGVFYRLSEVADILRELFPNAAITVGPGMDPYVSQAPIRGPLDITRAELELEFRVQKDLRGSMAHFVEMIHRNNGT
jgi:nucleoside-diphosphate-sugar epimerase